VTPVRGAASPAGPLCRIGRWPNPLVFLPKEAVGAGRFDDPRAEFRVLYAAEQRRACFVETLAIWRPSLRDLADLRAVWGANAPAPWRSAPDDWHLKRCLGRFHLLPGQRWLDLRAFETREALRAQFADAVIRLGLPDLDVSGVRGPSRALTQAIARWAYEQGYQGIAYSSRFDDAFDCWAVFEGAAFQPAGPPEPIARDDPDLRATAELFGLVV
jgi:hypothetical protein